MNPFIIAALAPLAPPTPRPAPTPALPPPPVPAPTRWVETATLWAAHRPWLALLVPLCTNAYYYAHEARAYALVLGCGGLSVLCWQAAAAWFSRFSSDGASHPPMVLA